MDCQDRKRQRQRNSDLCVFVYRIKHQHVADNRENWELVIFIQEPEFHAETECCYHEYKSRKIEIYQVSE